jgi:hypothetical protein
MGDLTHVISRVRKMLAVSKSDNEHEATLAAQRAAAIIEEYHLTEAQLRVEDDNKKAEPINQRVTLGGGKKRVAWKELIADGVAKSLGCHIYLTEEGPACFGRESATQAWSYTCQYLFNEVNRLADEAWEDECVMAAIAGYTPKKWKNSFRVGCAQSIIMRLYDSVDKKVVDTSTKALMIIESDQIEVNSEYHKFTEKMGKASAIGLVSNRTGYKAGLEIGQKIELGAKRAGLKEGQRSLNCSGCGCPEDAAPCDCPGFGR